MYLHGMSLRMTEMQEATYALGGPRGFDVSLGELKIWMGTCVDDLQVGTFLAGL